MPISAFNYRDPRYQRDMQRAAAKTGYSPFKGSRGAAGGVLASRLGNVTAEHAGRQADTQLKFGQLALDKRASLARHEMAKAQLAQKDKMLGLDFKTAALNRRAMKDRRDIIRSQGRALPLRIGLGAGQALLAYKMGRDRKAMMSEQLAAEKRRTAMMENSYLGLAPLGIGEPAGPAGIGGVGPQRY